MSRIRLVIGLACVLSAANAWGAGFLDDFNRSDGPVGNGWTIQTNGTITVEVVDNEVLIAGVQATDWVRCGISRPVSNETRISFDFKADDSFNVHVNVASADSGAFVEVYAWAGGPFSYASSADGGWPGWVAISGSEMVAGQYNNLTLEQEGTVFTVILNGKAVGTITNAGFTTIESVLISSDAAANTTGSLHIDNVLIGKVIAGVAKDPSPAGGAVDVPVDTLFGWTAGEFAAEHDVYLGTSFEDVNAAGRADPRGVLAGQGQTDATYDPEDAFEYGQTYYWRVDEVNASPDATIFKGEVWSFTTEPFAYRMAPIAATASSSQPGMVPQNTINESGLNADDQHSGQPTDMWMTTGDTPAWIQFEFDKVYKLQEMWVWNSNQLIEEFMGFGAKDVTVEYSTDGEAWTVLEGVPQFARAPASPNYAANTTVDLGVSAKFVKLTIHSNWGGLATQTGLSEVRFFFVPVQARHPQPAVAATGVNVEAELNWRPGREATSHQVFFDADREAVAGGTVAAETVENHSYAPEELMFATEYFWKVDEVGDAGTYPGDVWSFTTEEFALVEDFESYDNDNNRIYVTWVDGLTDDASGSQVGYDESPFAEMTIVHGGVQSMPLFYDNTDFAFSEAKRTFDDAQDWTARGIKSLSLFFYGAAGNSGKLYVKVNNTKVAYDGDQADLARAGWQAWNIDLSKAGNVGSVRSLTIGVEGSGAKGTLFIDDIRLYPKAPVVVTPAEPDAAGLIARYAFDGDVKDSSGKGRNGTANGGPTYAAGVDGQAIHLDGTDDYVAVGSVGISGAAPRTISGWVKADTTTITDWTNLFGFTSAPDGANALSFDMNKMGGANTYCIHAYGWERNIMTIDLEWHHLAATYDGTTVAWYGDGALAASEAWVLNTQDNVQMGKRAHAAGGNFPGMIDEVRIYDKALSAEEIAWLAGRRAPVHQPL